MATASAGVRDDAEVLLDAELLEWADVVFVMEKRHQNKMAKRFGAQLRGKRVVCLHVADDFRFMDPDLIALLEKRVGPHLPSPGE